MKGVDGPLPGHIFFACASSTPVKMKRNTCNHVATTQWAYLCELSQKFAEAWAGQFWQVNFGRSVWTGQFGQVSLDRSACATSVNRVYGI